jgi:GDP-L-fucose synthase
MTNYKMLHSVPRDAKVFVAGHNGMVGTALVRALLKEGFTNVVTRSRAELDLTNEEAVDAFFAAERPSYVYMAAAKVGGIFANDAYPADFLLDNLRIQNAVIGSAHRHKVVKIVYLGSTCIYPKLAEQPIQEESLLSGPLEPTNQWYAIAKIAGIKLCQALRKQHGFDAICVMPTNLYGPHDNFHPMDSHVLAAFIRRFVEARENKADHVTCWGTGTAYREFLHVDDLASACIHLMDTYSSADIVNIGTGIDITIKELAHMIADIVGYHGEIKWDASKPDGTPRKLCDVTRLTNLGFKPQIELKEGLIETIEWFVANKLKRK